MDLFFWRASFPIADRCGCEIEMENIKSVTTQLGLLYKKEYGKTKEKPHKIGIRKIYDSLDQKVTKRQIKKFVRLHTSCGDTVRIPYKSIVIFTALAQLIDDNPQLQNFCKHQCLNCVNSRNSAYCREKLMGSFCDFIVTHSNQLNERAKEEVLEPLLRYGKKCK